jgi:hypothetical protein
MGELETGLRTKHTDLSDASKICMKGTTLVRFLTV